MQKHDAAWEASLYALNGIMGNPVNEGKTVAEIIEQAINLGVGMASRWEQIIGTANMTPVVNQYFTVGAIPATPAINFTVSLGNTVNMAQRSAVSSTVPTSVKNPDGSSIAPRQDSPS